MFCSGRPSASASSVRVWCGAWTDAVTLSWPVDRSYHATTPRPSIAVPV
jgi:hypothetical protein